MYSKKKKEAALKVFHQTDSISDMIRNLSYPTTRQLYNWIAKESTSPKERRELPRIANPPDHPRSPPLEVKLDAIKR